MLEWCFDRNFRLSITRDAAGARVALMGELDAITAKNLELRVRLPELPGSDVVIDLTELEAVDTAGARQIRRIESLYAGCELHGVSAALQELLEFIDRRST